MSDPKTSKDPFSRYDPRRKYNQALIVVLAVLLLAILFTIATHLRTNSISEALRNDLNSLFPPGTDAASTNDLMKGTKQALSSARTQLLVLGIISVGVALMLIYRYIASGIRSVALEVWIRHLGEGNLDYHVEMKGRDEIAEAAVALEALRQRSIRALQLDLVEKLSRELQDRNEELEQVLLELRQTQEQIILRQRQSIDGQGEPYAPTLRLKTRRLEDTIEVRVRDNGTGISPDIMDKIFNPFFTTKPAGKGTGLGLSLSNDVVRQHGGSIAPDSELGDFTEMAVSIPIRDDVEQASD